MPKLTLHYYLNVLGQRLTIIVEEVISCSCCRIIEVTITLGLEIFSNRFSYTYIGRDATTVKVSIITQDNILKKIFVINRSLIVIFRCQGPLNQLTTADIL